MTAADCQHENRLEWGSYALCFDCGAERGPQAAPAPAPSIREQRLERVGAMVRGPRRDESPDPGVCCPVCGDGVSSLHALTAHAIESHPLPEAVLA